MAIEATGILADSAHSRLISGEKTRPRETAARDAAALVEEGRDRFISSPSARHKHLATRFRRLAADAFERPEKKDRIAKELEQRFREALHTLKQLGVLDPHEVKNLRKTFHHALKAIESTGAPATEFSGESSVQQSRTYSLDVETVEGDTVRIRLERQTRVDESLSVGFNVEEAIAVQAGRTVTNQSSLSFTVVGDLNEEERAAIEDLVARVDLLAARFFDGDVQAALQYAREFGLPDDEIAAFSVDLGYSLEARAIAAYGDVEALAGSSDAPEAWTAEDLFDDLRSLAESARLERLFVASRRLVFEFFRGAVETGSDDTAGLPA